MSEDVGTFVAAASVAVAAASAVFVGLQLRQLAKQTKLANVAAQVHAMRELSADLQDVNLLFVDKPELRPFFYEGADTTESEVHRHQVESAAEAIANVLETNFYIARNMPPFAHENRPGLLDYLRSLLDHSPAFEFVVDRHRLWWPELVREIDGLGGFPRRKQPA